MVLLAFLTFLTLSFLPESCQVCGELSLGDIVVAMPSSTARHSIMLSTRSWRSSMHTVITTNDTIETEDFFRDNPASAPDKQETILSYPDEVYLPKRWRHAPRVGEIRAALTPFLAHEHFVKSSQSYKWLLYGERCSFIIFSWCVLLSYGGGRWLVL